MIAPLAAREPYNAVAAAPRRTVISSTLSMSRSICRLPAEPVPSGSVRPSVAVDDEQRLRAAGEVTFAADDDPGRCTGTTACAGDLRARRLRRKRLHYRRL